MSTYYYLLSNQILKNGFFHADPHPGNISVATDGTLIYYDFGMMGEIKSFTRERLLQLFYAIYEKDVNKVYLITMLLCVYPRLSLTNCPIQVTACLIELETLRPTGDLSAVSKLFPCVIKTTFTLPQCHACSS